VKDKRQLELNFDDPTEYLAPPTYLGNTTHCHSNSAPTTLVVKIPTNVTIKRTLLAAPQIGDEEGA
jgi:hypothetical protein